ncbi:MAG TPA: glycosyltransferase family 1 protein [Acidimicrobiia bacterium]|nr:glycosyltransferase family 1 protein [Acidimicrobiia bacterium]
MRIGVNLLFVEPGAVGGSEALLTNLVRAVGASGHDLVVAAMRGFRSAHPDIESFAEVVEVPWRANHPPVRIVAENSWLAAMARRRHLDVVHHGVGTAPFVKALPTVVTLHDIQYRHYPEYFHPAKLAWLRANVPFVVRHSEVVTVPSHFVREDVLAAFDPDPDRIVVVPFGSEGLLAPSAGAAAVRKRHRLERPFFFFPGRSYPHKNHRFLVEAFAPLASRADLVLTGPPGPRDAEIAETAARLGVAGAVRRIGLVSRPELAALYESAEALAWPSRFEGFGVPVLEAMGAGCPVVASRATAIPEVVGDAGILLSPDDAPGWTEALDGLLSDPGLRSDLVRRGRERLKEFSWERSGVLQVAAYEQAVGG